MSEYMEREAAICIADYAADEHPYKDPQKPETYSDYNQGWNDACDYIRERLENEKAADVMPVVHGRWIEDERTYTGAGLSNNLCSVCGRVGGTWKKGLKPERKWCFCPNCGAKMDGGAE